MITAAGVLAGIDMTLVLASRIAGHDFAQGVQLGIEYDPLPPFAAGSPPPTPTPRGGRRTIRLSCSRAGVPASRSAG